VWKYFTDLFDYLPLGVLIENQYFCIHAGLSPNIESLDQIKSIMRTQEIPQGGPMSDLLWSDPEERLGWGVSPRGAGYLFGADITKKFNFRNGIKLICRAHQLVMEGYTFSHEKNLVTIFSAPNYCNRCGNDAAILELDENMNSIFFCYSSSNAKPDSSSKFKIPDYFL